MALARVRVRVPTRAFVPRARARARMTTARASLSSYLPSDTYRSLPKDGDVTFLRTMIRAKDLERTMSFFAALGLRETRRKDSDKGKFTLVFMASAPGAPEIEITHNWPDENGETETFARESFDGTPRVRRRRRVRQVRGTSKRWHRHQSSAEDGRMAFVISPDGISVELLQKGDALYARRKPWASMQNVGSW